MSALACRLGLRRPYPECTLACRMELLNAGGMAMLSSGAGFTNASGLIVGISAGATVYVIVLGGA